MSMEMGRKENMKAKSFCVTEGKGRGIGILSIPTQLQGGGDRQEIKNQDCINFILKDVELLHLQFAKNKFVFPKQFGFSF